MSESMAQGTEETSVNRREQSILPVLADICDEESRWIDIDPPTPEQERSEPNILGNWVDEDGRVGDEGVEYPIKAGFLMETRENSDDVLHKVFRTSKYNVHYRLKRMTIEDALPRLPADEREAIKAEIERGEVHPDEEVSIGQVFVREADGYTKDEQDD